MQSSRLRLNLVLLLTLLGACAPLGTQVPNTQSTPSHGDSWTITLRQSGGFVGVDKTVQVSSDGQLVAADQRSGRRAALELAPKSISELSQLYYDAASPAQAPRESACADCFVYDLAIETQGGNTDIRLDDTSLAGSKAGPLIHYLIQLRDAALATP